MRYLILFVFLYSCSAEYHLNKAIKKGYRCEETGDTIRISTIDSIPYVVNDTIFWEKILTTKDTVIQYKKVYVPKTKWQIKTELRFQRDTIRIKEKTKQAEAKAEAKSKKRPNLYLLLIGFLLGLIVAYLFKKAAQKLNI